MNTLSLIAGVTIRLSLLTGAALAGQNDALKPLQLAADAQRTIGRAAQPEPFLASIAQLLAQ